MCFIMFDNIGEKIKSLAVILCRIGIIVYILAAIAMIIFGSSNYEEAITAWGVIVLIAGPFLSIANSLIIYGFGELIEKVCIIERNICGEKNKTIIHSKSETERTAQIDKLRSQGLITEEEYKKAVSKQD